ncbi:Peptidase S1, PA clan, chymotrypsin-like fold [Fusarium oxysporum f. sp. vasinfectum]|nr:Peptidase S1, PA clan, chymotrypsin-like fold [Fusarium oxysporum f. sp. vasinfectum]
MPGTPEKTTSSFPTRKVFEGVLETSAFINLNTPTPVALWNMEKPSLSESVTVRLRGAGTAESLGPEGDHRVKASLGRFNPPGHYKAICKLFLGYSNGHDEFIGTGWLVNEGIVVTAGHNLYDWSYMGGFLKYVKCYFGYEGTRSPGLYRHGVKAAAPAEYLKAESSVHDVGFFRLNEKVTDMTPIPYSVTPPTATAQLGVVGYPGDLDFGEHLYEDWATVHIDLARSGALLSYRIDTSGGQTGAPVLRKRDDGRLEAIGVHVCGGYPNVGSVIGPYGNTFEEYILALDGKDGVIKSSTITIAQRKGLAPGFQLLSFQPQSTHTNPAVSTADVLGGDKGCFDEKGATRKFKAEGSLTTLPETLKLTETKNHLPQVDFDKAFKNAKDQDDVRTTFFINFTEPLEGEALEDQQKLISSIKTWQAWATINCEAKVQQQVDAGALPSDSKGQIARSTYRAKVFDFLFNRTTWFLKTFDEATHKRIKTRAASFHSKILTNVLEGYAIPTSAFANLEKLIKQIAEGIKLSGESSREPQQYWVMFTKSEYEEITQTVQAVIRVISFQVTQDAKHYASRKGSYDEVSFDFNFHQYQAEFVEAIFDGVKDKMDKRQIEQGEELLENRITDVVVPTK